MHGHSPRALSLFTSPYYCVLFLVFLVQENSINLYENAVHEELVSAQLQSYSDYLGFT